MGLDMYLKIRKVEYKSSFKEENLYPQELKKFEEKILVRNFASVETFVDYQVGYWRKANAIHKWFVDNCAEGEDNCEPIIVQKEKLEELLHLCQDTLLHKNKAQDILPTTSGFFFGSQEYGEWYFEDIEYTEKLLKEVLDFVKKQEEQDKYYDVVYEASW